MADKPLVSIIIANWNGASHLEDCLASIEAQTYRSIETVLIDNASVDSSVELVRAQFPRVRIVQNEINRGFCASNNQGAREASGELLFLLNNDTVIAPDCVEQMVKALK